MDLFQYPLKQLSNRITMSNTTEMISNTFTPGEHTILYSLVIIHNDDSTQ